MEGIAKEDIIIDKTNATRSIAVSGFPKGTTAEALVIHFQQKKHGGGDIKAIQITDKGLAVIVFDEPAGPFEIKHEKS